MITHNKSMGSQEITLRIFSGKLPKKCWNLHHSPPKSCVGFIDVTHRKPIGKSGQERQKSPPICFTGDIRSEKIGSLTQVHDLPLSWHQSLSPSLQVSLSQKLSFSISLSGVWRRKEKWKQRGKERNEKKRKACTWEEKRRGGEIA